MTYATEGSVSHKAELMPGTRPRQAERAAKGGVPGQIRTAAPGSGGRYSIQLSYGDALKNVTINHYTSFTPSCKFQSSGILFSA